MSRVNLSFATLAEQRSIRVCIKARANKSKQHFADYRHFVYQCGSLGKFINPCAQHTAAATEKTLLRALENFHTRIHSRQRVYKALRKI
jgi:hypothetical protein